MKVIAIVIALLMSTAMASESYYEEPMNGMNGMDGADGMNGANGVNGSNGTNGSNGDSYGAAFGLIQYTYDPTITEWQGQVGIATFSGDNAYSAGIGKKVIGGFLNLNVGTSDGDTGAGAAYGWVFK